MTTSEFHHRPATLTKLNSSRLLCKQGNVADGGDSLDPQICMYTAMMTVQAQAWQLTVVGLVSLVAPLHRPSMHHAHANINQTKHSIYVYA